MVRMITAMKRRGARFHDCEQSAEQFANKNQALFDMKKLAQAGARSRVSASRK